MKSDVIPPLLFVLKGAEHRAKRSYAAHAAALRTGTQNTILNTTQGEGPRHPEPAFGDRRRQSASRRVVPEPEIPEGVRRAGLAPSRPGRLGGTCNTS